MDIYVGVDPEENKREALLIFLQEHCVGPFALTKCRYLRQRGEKDQANMLSILRVRVDDAFGLAAIIFRSFTSAWGDGESFEYKIYPTFLGQEHDKTWIADTDSERGPEPFDIMTPGLRSALRMAKQA